MTVYRAANGKGWMEVIGEEALYAPGPEWRLATAPERARYALTKDRFSWIDLVAIIIIANGALTLIRMVTG